MENNTTMTIDEFDKRVSEHIKNGGFTLENALELSIEKWERSRTKEAWNSRLIHFGSAICGLCEYATRQSTVNKGIKDSCVGCPLASKEVDSYGNPIDSCDVDDSLYNQIMDAAHKRDKLEYMELTLELINKMKKALEDLRNDKPL